MIHINFIVQGAKISASAPPVASGSAEAVEARFSTDGTFAGMALTAVFRAGTRTYLQPIFSGKCLFPAEVLALPGRVYVGLFGTDGVSTVTTAFCAVDIEQGVPTAGENAENHTPSLYEQFAAKFARIENMTVTAESGENASVTVADADGALRLHFTLPRGERYTLTEADKTEIRTYVTDAILGGAW